MDLKITFYVEDAPFCAKACCENREILAIRAENGHLECKVAYSEEERPLMLQSEVSAGTKAELILMRHRIELYVDGRLCDEEWPYGKRLFELESDVAGDPLTISRYEEEKTQQPAVLASFADAQGWRPEENVFVGDCMPYRRGDEYHVLYLKDRHHHKSKWGLGAHQWEHISTKDFVNWAVHPMAVGIDDPEEGSICTGSWITHEGKEYLYYTVRRPKGAAAPICRSVSDDGWHFEKDCAFGFVLPEGYDAASARDPKVIRDEKGLYHMLLTTSLESTGKGCLAHLISEDFEHWHDYGAPIYVSETEDQPECPDYIAYHGRYYLIFSLRGQAHYLISEQPFDGWRVPKEDIIPCHSVPKGALWEDKIVFAGFIPCGGYGGNMTFRSAHAAQDGEWIFE